MGGTPVNLFGPAQAPQPGLMDVLLQRFMTGMSIGHTIKSANQQAEQQKLQMEVLKHQLDSMKLEGKIAPLRQQLEIAKLLQGMPGRQLPMSVDPQSVDVPGLADLGGATQPSGATTTFGLSPSTGSVETPNAPINIDLSAVFPGRGQMEVPIQNQTQMLNQALREAFARSTIEAQGAGMKAGAEARARTPYEMAIEEAKAKTAEEAAVRNDTREFERTKYIQGQENVRSGRAAQSRVDAAEIGAAATRAGAATNLENTLRGDYDKATTRHVNILEQAGSIKAAAAEQGMGGDIILVTAFNKLVDDSVVREPEYKRAAAVGGAVQKAKAYLAQVQGKGYLEPGQREEILKITAALEKVASQRMNVENVRFAGIAQRKGANPQNVIRTPGDFSAGAPVAPEGSIVSDPQGKQYRIVNGQPVPVS